jgi:hypothetical protein|tara:strand:- start:1389 stop:1769 length:381 start_codon:yes stop_codon:yes gene_type:complete
MKADKKFILETVKKVIAEAAKIKFAGHQFMLKVDVNEDPQKKGLKIQFIPTTFGQLSNTERNDIAIELEQRLEAGLDQYDMRVERDRNLKDKTIIGFFVYIEYFDKLVRKALSGQNPSKIDNKEEI